jgi:hypothetical protein
MRSALAERILRAVNDHGVMLVYDRVLPCVTRLVIGEPIAGSWWSHPMAKSIYNALGEFEDSVKTVKLVGAKDTLVAERLWADLVQAGMAPTHAQLAGLDDEASSLLRQIKTVTEPVIVDKTVRDHAKVLAARLLVACTPNLDVTSRCIRRGRHGAENTVSNLPATPISRGTASLKSSLPGLRRPARSGCHG